MSESHDDGGPAFPHTWTETNEYGVSFFGVAGGMTLRDWFAGQASAAMALKAFGDDLTTAESASLAAAWSYAIADAMIEARK